MHFVPRQHEHCIAQLQVGVKMLEQLQGEGQLAAAAANDGAPPGCSDPPLPHDRCGMGLIYFSTL